MQDPLTEIIESYVCLSLKKIMKPMSSKRDFRQCLDERIELFPELFPPEIVGGYRMKDIGKAEGSGKPRGRNLNY